MKYLKILISSFLILMLTACATTAESEADKAKYEFNELTELSSIPNWRLDSWDVIDSKSLIVETLPNQSYLLVLATPIQNLKIAVGILVSSSVGSVKARFDTVSTARNPMFKSSIQTIYKLDSDEQITAVKQQIAGE